MDTEELAEARQRTQEALSRARLATDPATKREWQELAKSWLDRLKQLEHDAAPVSTVGKPRVVATSDSTKD
jgi:hypothetical protein